MKTAYKVDIPKILFLFMYFPFFLTVCLAWAQPGKDCGEAPFTSEILKIEKNAACYDIALEISTDGNARFELSHATIY